MNEQAATLASRIEQEAGEQDEDRIRRGFELVLQRQADPDEVAAGLELLRTLESDGLERHDALKYHCLVLLNLNEFIFVD